MYKVIDMDISDSVFDNDISAFMYIIKDIYTDGYINAIPSILFFRVPLQVAMTTNICWNWI